MAVELFTAAQAVDLRLAVTPGARLGQGTAQALAAIRAVAPHVERDQLYGPALEAVAALVASPDWLGLAG